MRITVKRGEQEIVVNGYYWAEYDTNACGFEIASTDPPDVELTDEEHDFLVQEANRGVWGDDDY